MTPFATQADSADDFGWVFIAKINENAEADVVDAMIESIMGAARGNTGVLVFNFSRVGDTIYGYELFDNQVALFEHFSRVEALVPQMLELWTPTSVVPTHDLPVNVADVMKKLGALQPDMTSSLVH